MNPTAIINLDFACYLASRERKLSSHLIGGIPDYSFSLDQKLRQQLASMGPVRAITQSLVSWIVPLQKQIQQMQAVAVGPSQYPDIYNMGVDCARQLGIGIPEIFIFYSPIINAYTIATDDVEPIIILSSALVEVLEPSELKFVIGHECGHIHNLHGVYNTAVELLSNTLAKAMFASFPALGTLRLLLQGGLTLFFMRWSRCAEITSDRAGLICCEDFNAAQMALAKLSTGGISKLAGINIQEYIKQISKVGSSPVRLLELTQSHPLIPKRLEAIRLFSECDLLSTWLAEFSCDYPQSKSQVDQKCEQIISVISTKYNQKSSPNPPKNITIE